MLAGLIVPDRGHDPRRRDRRRARAAAGPVAPGRAVRCARPVSAPDRAREHRLLRTPARAGARGRRSARRDAGRTARDEAPARPSHRRLQPGRADEDRAGARPGARSGSHRARRADQRPGRAGHARPARDPAPPAQRRGRPQVHRDLDPHHAGGRAAVRPRRGRRRRPQRRARARSPNCSPAPRGHDFEQAFVQLAFGAGAA